MFLNASDYGFLPTESASDLPKEINLVVKSKQGVKFTSPVGIGARISVDGSGIDGLLDSSRDAKTGMSTFIEVGPCTPEK